jgi:hypothetical protein
VRTKTASAPQSAVPLWPADQVERRAVAGLVPYARNARTHSPQQIAQLAASIREWGWTVPVLVDEAGTIIAGHGRVLAAQQLGIADVPVMVARGWSEAQRRAYVIADNKLAENAGWDEALLKIEVGDLASMGFEVPLLGFSESEIASLNRSPGLTDPDAAPDPPAIPVTQPGDMWQLGRHRLICGDATKAEDVQALLAGAKPHLMVTDPPYGVDYEPDWRMKASGYASMNRNPVLPGAVGKVTNDGHADWRAAWALFPGDVAYVWHAGTRAGEVAASLASRPGNTHADYLGQTSIGDWPGTLPRAARALLVRRARRLDRALAGRPHADDALADQQATKVRDRAFDAKAGRVHETADRE